MAQRTDLLCAAVAAEPRRTPAEVRVTEILPLLAACEFLEKHAASILATQSLGTAGRPIWLTGVRAEIQRVALERVLVIGPSNYPLFLPGVQVLQGLAAGNAVTWKPGRGGRAVAKVFAEGMAEAGLPRELLRLTEESVEAGRDAIEAGTDKVFFTGSGAAGRSVMRQLAETATPCVMELSDNSAVIVLPQADLGRVAAAVVFGMRLNGSATCMAPRRLLVMGSTLAARRVLVTMLERALAAVAPVQLEATVLASLRAMMEEARTQGATILGEVSGRYGDSWSGGQRPVLIVDAKPAMRIAQTDIFAPVLSVIDVSKSEEVAAAQRECPFGLAVSIFGEEKAARRMAGRLQVGTVVINDLIVPTADPRVPFGGRGGSGFGVTRGAAGLLEMTAARTVLVRRGKSQRQYEATGDAHAELFDGLTHAAHSRTVAQRFKGLKQIIEAGRKLGTTKVAAQEQPAQDRNQV